MATTLVIALGPLTTLDAVLISHTHPIVTSEINYLLETCHGMSYTCRCFFERSPGSSGEHVE